MDKMTIIFLIFLAFSIVFFIIMMICGKREKEKLEVTTDNTQDFETIEINAEVIDLACTNKMVGMKHPKSIEEYCVSFKKDDGEKMSFSVSKDFYDGFEIGQSGVLTLVGGEVYSFIPTNK